MDLRRLSRTAAGALGALLLAACQGGGTNPASPFTGTVPPAGQLSASPSSLTFSGTGATFAQAVTVTTTVAVSAASITVAAPTCGSGATAIVTFAAPSGSGLTYTDVVTPQNVGTCSATVSSSAEGTATVTFTVNAAAVTISGGHAS